MYMTATSMSITLSNTASTSWCYILKCNNKFSSSNTGGQSSASWFVMQFIFSGGQEEDAEGVKKGDYRLGFLLRSMLLERRRWRTCLKVKCTLPDFDHCS